MKYHSTDPEQWNIGQSTLDVFIFRYAEVLLNYAEAKAELGECTQEVLDQTVNELRDRVEMPHLKVMSVSPIRTGRIMVMNSLRCFTKSAASVQSSW